MTRVVDWGRAGHLGYTAGDDGGSGFSVPDSIEKEAQNQVEESVLAENHSLGEGRGIPASSPCSGLCPMPVSTSTVAAGRGE